MRKLFAVVLVLVMLVGCGAQTASVTPSPTPVPTATQEVVEAPSLTVEEDNWVEPIFDLEAELHEATYLAPSNWRSVEADSPEGMYYYPYDTNDKGILYISYQPMEELADVDLGKDEYVEGIFDSVIEGITGSDQPDIRERKRFRVSGYPAVEFKHSLEIDNVELGCLTCVVLTQAGVVSVVAGEPDKLSANFEVAAREFIDKIEINTNVVSGQPLEYEGELIAKTEALFAEDNSSITAFIALDEGIKGYALLSLGSDDMRKNAGKLAAVVYLFNEFGVDTYTIFGTLDEESFSLSFVDGEAQPSFMPIPEVLQTTISEMADEGSSEGFDEYVVLLTNMTDADGNLMSEKTESGNGLLPALDGGDDAASQIDVGELRYSSRYYDYTFMTVKNNSVHDLDIRLNVSYFDEDGDLIGVDDRSQEAVESGHEVVIVFMPDEKYSYLEYEVETKASIWGCVLSDLSYEVTEGNGKIILSVTNNGSAAADFVEAYVLFYDGEDIVGFESHYIIDDDSEIKPGDTRREEFDCREDFDSYRIFLTGRR